MLFLLFALASSSAVQINHENIDLYTQGKNVFLKFYDPNCYFSKFMADPWNELATHFLQDDSILIGKIDCKAPENEELCELYEIDHYPTLKYGKSIRHLTEFVGNAYDSKQSIRFVEEMDPWKPICSPVNTVSCSGKEMKHIVNFMQMDFKDLESLYDNMLEEEKELKQNWEDVMDSTAKSIWGDETPEYHTKDQKATDYRKKIADEQEEFWAEFDNEIAPKMNVLEKVFEMRQNPKQKFWWMASESDRVKPEYPVEESEEESEMLEESIESADAKDKKDESEKEVEELQKEEISHDKTEL